MQFLSSHSNTRSFGFIVVLLSSIAVGMLGQGGLTGGPGTISPPRGSDQIPGPSACQPGPAGATDPVRNPACAELDQEILASVVQQRYRFRDDSGRPARRNLIAHGTVVNGRFLVVHNHFSALSALSSFSNRGVAPSLALLSPAGRLLAMYTGRLPYAIAARDSETLLLDFGWARNGQPYFDWLKVPSAKLLSWDQLPSLPGQTLAQITFDGLTANVAWSTVREVIVTDGTPRILLSTALRPGASGGGVFLGRYHIATNWQLIEAYDSHGQLLDAYSTAALNSPGLVARTDLQAEH